MTNNENTENLIYRVGQCISFGMSKAEIADRLSPDFAQHEIFFAYEAAVILQRDWMENYCGV